MSNPARIFKTLQPKIGTKSGLLNSRIICEAFILSGLLKATWVQTQTNSGGSFFNQPIRDVVSRFCDSFSIQNLIAVKTLLAKTRNWGGGWGRGAANLKRQESVGDIERQRQDELFPEHALGAREKSAQLVRKRLFNGQIRVGPWHGGTGAWGGVGWGRKRGHKTRFSPSLVFRSIPILRFVGPMFEVRGPPHIFIHDGVFFPNTSEAPFSVTYRMRDPATSFPR